MARRQDAEAPQVGRGGPLAGRPRWLACLLIGGLLCASIAGPWLAGLPVGSLLQGQAAGRAPEAAQVLAAQAGLPFQVLVPGYLPPGFDRAGAEVTAGRAGAGTGAALEIVYRQSASGAAVFLDEWMPGNRELETLAGARPIETKWGRAAMAVDRSSGLTTVWVDVGLLRIALESPRGEPVTPELALAIVESLGPAANRQVTSILDAQPRIRAAAPAPPVEAKVDERGVQELTLVATSAGYFPAHFALRAGVPARLIFRSLGDAACAAELVFPSDPAHPATLSLRSPSDSRTLEFTLQEAGDFGFHCVHNIYQGVMTVHQ